MKIEGIPSRINQNGRVVIPAVIRKAMGLNLGDTIFLSLEDGVIRIDPHQTSPRGAHIVQEKPSQPTRNVSRGSHVDTTTEEASAGMEEWLG
jgi:AbrB family looped-hinge helix DNA binding protein